MSTKTSLAFLSAVVIASMFAGCVPSDAEIAADMTASRREAYLEWKNMRDRGETREAMVDGPLSLDDAIKLALQYNKPLQSALQDREVTRGERISAYQVVLPSLSAAGSYTRSEHRRSSTNLHNYAANVTVTQPIMQGERIPATLRQARLMTALTDETIRAQVQSLISAVANNYYDILLAQHMVETHREALISAEAQYRMVSEKKKQETATEYDVLRAQVDVANYRARMQTEQNAIDTNRVFLLKNMGVSQDSQISFSDKLEFLPMRPVFERAVELASGLRPDLRQAELTSRMADEAVRISQSAFWPNLAASFSQGWNENTHNTFKRNPWTFGLNASYTLGIEDYGDLVSKRGTAKKRQIEILDAQEVALQEIRQQMNNLSNAEETVRYLEVNQDAAREALRLVEVGYQAGVKTEVDVTDARKALTEVIGQYYQALADHTKARLNLQVAMGVLGPTRVVDGTQAAPRVPIANIEEFAATDYEPMKPLPMPTSDWQDNSRRTPPGPTSAAPAINPQGDFAMAKPVAKPAQARPQPVQAKPVAAAPAPRVAPAPVPVAAPVAPVVDSGRAVSSASDLPLPVPVTSAPHASLPVPPPAPSQPVVAVKPPVAAQPAVIQETGSMQQTTSSSQAQASAEPADSATPLFRVKVG